MIAARATEPHCTEVDRGMTIRLDARNRPEADIVVSSTPHDPDRTRFEPGEVLLVVEVVSPESAFRDRNVKPREYAPTGIFRDSPHVPVPFGIDLDLAGLRPGR